MVQVRGRVAETLEGEAALAVIDRISQDYIGGPFPMRTGVVFLVEPEQGPAHGPAVRAQAVGGVADRPAR